MAITLKRIQQLEKILEAADWEINSIIQDYYAVSEGQNVGGNIGQISKLHVEIVEALAEEKRKLLTNEKK